MNSVYNKLVQEYEELWRKNRKAGTYDAERLRILAARCIPLADPDYMQVMWERRAWLHGRQRNGHIYDGRCAKEWKRSMVHGTPFTK